MFYGRGEGSLPTASSVAADIINIASHISDKKCMQSRQKIWERNPDLFSADLSESEYKRMTETLGEPLNSMLERV